MGWDTDAANREFVAEMDRKAQAVMREGTSEEESVSYASTTWVDLLGYRYKCKGRVERLRDLKRRVDSTGGFHGVVVVIGR